ncbi:MAG: 4-alpha-glucanotransferase [Actinobacteria bacterium]|nr:4-alpha-glucanotransferase [Actinomycetota bacterium]
MNAADPRSWGIEEGYHDYQGVWRDAPRASIEAFLDVMGASAEGPEEPNVLIVHPGDDIGIAGEIILEDGGRTAIEGVVRDVPLGYHTFYGRSRETRLIVSPGAGYLQGGMRKWGWALQLYALRSSRSWGIGDLSDLAECTRWAISQGAGTLLVNPLHAAAGDQASPYFPTSRCYRNPIYLSIDDLTGAAEVEGLAELRAQGRALNSDRRIDRAAVNRLKSEALRLVYERAGRDPAFDDYVRSEGELLESFAAFEVLRDLHGTDWTKWPGEYRRPDRGAVGAVCKEHPDARFQMWLQYRLDRSLTEAGASVDLVQDLAVGIDPLGFDAWYWQDQVAQGISVGAPPDEFNTAGQSWGVTTFDPWALRAAAYEPFVRTIRANLTGGGLRIDHVMGLFRLFWVPPGADASEGTYVRYPAHDLLDIVALESHRAEAFVVGEDLGTIEDGVREELAHRRFLSYKVLWFEPGDPSGYPTTALATVTNHDLPTIPGMWTGADLEAQRAAGLHPNEGSEHAIRGRLRDMAGAADDAPVEEVVERAYRLLARAPSMILTATFEDALGVEERPNQPGTTDERPNWSLALPLPLEAIEEHDGPQRIAEALGR